MSAAPPPPHHTPALKNTIQIRRLHSGTHPVDRERHVTVPATPTPAGPCTRPARNLSRLAPAFLFSNTAACSNGHSVTGVSLYLSQVPHSLHTLHGISHDEVQKWLLQVVCLQCIQALQLDCPHLHILLPVIVISTLPLSF